MTLIRIIARRVPWPDLSKQSNREGLRLRWDALSEEGELLVERTEYPLHDAAHLLLERGVPSNARITMRREGTGHDCFLPIPLGVAARLGEKRAAARAVFSAKREELRKETATEPLRSIEGQTLGSGQPRSDASEAMG